MKANAKAKAKRKIRIAGKLRKMILAAYDAGYILGSNKKFRSPLLTPDELTALFELCKRAVQP